MVNFCSILHKGGMIFLGCSKSFIFIWRMIRLVFIWFVFGMLPAMAQPPMERDFLAYQKSFKKVDDAFQKMEDTLKAQFSQKGLEWPARYMYIRSFKLDSRLEIWVKNKASEPYKKFKNYKVCALAGSLGPKRYEGDYQVPEGFYYINEFRPNSQYHLALGVNYPNASDRVLSDKKRPGGDIFVHGSCVTVGCIPLTDPVIEEVYVLAASTRAAGQDFIPIHVFPVNFKVDKSKDLLEKYLETRPDYRPFAENLEKAYYYFEEKRQLPTIYINAKGEYDMLQDYLVPPRPMPIPPPPPFKENTAARRSAAIKPFAEEQLNGFIVSPPVYPGGMKEFSEFINELSNELGQWMPKGKKRVYIPVEFIVDATGKVVNVKVDKNANNEMNNHILARFEAMAAWKPALAPKEKPVPRKLIQTIIVNEWPEDDIPVSKKMEEQD